MGLRKSVRYMYIEKKSSWGRNDEVRASSTAFGGLNSLSRFQLVEIATKDADKRIAWVNNTGIHAQGAL
jgi:hypothetical protein